MKSIKQLIFERETNVQQDQQTPAPASKGSQEIAPYREPAKILINITKGIEPFDQRGQQLKSKLKKPMEQFINFENLHDDKKISLLFKAIEQEAKSQGMDEASIDKILQLVGGTHPAWTKRVLNLFYSLSPYPSNA